MLADPRIDTAIEELVVKLARENSGRESKVRCKDRLGGLLNYYHREAA